MELKVSAYLFLRDMLYNLQVLVKYTTEQRTSNNNMNT